MLPLEYHTSVKKKKYFYVYFMCMGTNADYNNSYQSTIHILLKQIFGTNLFTANYN